MDSSGTYSKGRLEVETRLLAILQKGISKYLIAAQSYVASMPAKIASSQMRISGRMPETCDCRSVNTPHRLCYGSSPLAREVRRITWGG